MNKFKFFALGAILVATLGAFAGQRKNALVDYYGYYKPINSNTCSYGPFDDFQECSTYASGPLCTINGNPAYETYWGCYTNYTGNLMYRVE